MDALEKMDRNHRVCRNNAAKIADFAAMHCPTTALSLGKGMKMTPLRRHVITSGNNKLLVLQSLVMSLRTPNGVEASRAWYNRLV